VTIAVPGSVPVETAMVVSVDETVVVCTEFPGGSIVTIPGAGIVSVGEPMSMVPTDGSEAMGGSTVTVTGLGILLLDGMLAELVLEKLDDGGDG
jgi:hypothetical protein